LLVDWLAQYRLDSESESSSGEDFPCEQMSFSRDDFKIQSDLIDGKRIYSMKNPKFKNVHPGPVRQLA